MVQDNFLEKLKQNNISVTIFLQNGVKLQGLIAGQDSQSIILKRAEHEQLVYKHAISTIMPSTQFNSEKE